ncbi:hypothetical protein RCL_jg8085.t1 [Rhizophagus clarus]|uniref:Uncharacterized protein n=1 Tax=Rhizophagus clarus TaxID=94130 RepID=A0A8H3R600_9GLOM|nr:hypothetical protein RCL_jg8085.t1 [Rhizophagus clarus]
MDDFFKITSHSISFSILVEELRELGYCKICGRCLFYFLIKSWCINKERNFHDKNNKANGNPYPPFTSTFVFFSARIMKTFVGN